MKRGLDLGISPKIYSFGLLITLLLLVPPVKVFFVESGHRWAYILGISFGICFSIIPLLRFIAFKSDILDKPDPRKIHKEPTPLLGGAGVFFGYMKNGRP